MCVYLPLQVISMLLPLVLQSIKQKSITLTEAQSSRKNNIMQGVFAFVFIFVVASVASGLQFTEYSHQLIKLFKP
nr:hypothetical protein [Entomoplasma sp. MP1]